MAAPNPQMHLTATCRRKCVRQGGACGCGMHPGVTVVTMLIELAFKRVKTGDTIMDTGMLYLK